MSNENYQTFPQDLLNLLLFGKYELSFFNYLSKELSLKQELILIDKNFLVQWKNLSGYNLFKKPIFNYFTFITTNRQNQYKQKDAKNKLISLWQNTKNSKKLNPDEVKTLPKMNISINTKNNNCFIPFQLLNLFNNKINEVIKLNGIFNKGKLLCTLNYINFNLIYMLFIKDEKDFYNIIFDELYFELPLNNNRVFSKIEDYLHNENIKTLKEKYNDIISDKTNIMIINFNDNGNNYQYKVFKKNTSIDNSNINISQNDYESKLNDLALEKKMYDEENDNLIKEENLLEQEIQKLNNDKIKLYQLKNETSNLYATFHQNNETDFDSDIKNKILIAQKEYQQKLDEFEKIKQKVTNKKRYIIQEKRKFQKVNKSSEKQLNNNEDELIKKRENDLLIKEKSLREKEILIKQQQKIINDKEKELDTQIFNIDQKLIYYKNKNFLINQNKNKKEEIENEISDGELEEIQKEIEIENNNKKNEKNLKCPIFFNELIQCFAHLKEVTTGFFELDNKKFFIKNKDTKLAKNYCDILKNIVNNKKYQSENFIKIFNKMYNNLNNIGLLNFIKIFIENLHNELNIKKNSNQDNNQLIEGTNQNEVLIKYIKQFTQNNNSIISKYFFGLIKFRIICSSCNNTYYNYNKYSYLSFSIMDIKLKIKNKITLDDCFNYYRTKCLKINHLCQNCGESENNLLYRSIYSSQAILLIILDRGEGNEFCRDEVQFNEELNLEKYIEYNRSYKKFFLCGVISIFFAENNLKKYCAFYREEKNSQWYYYYNEKINLCNINDIYTKGIPTMLIYHKE